MNFKKKYHIFLQPTSQVLSQLPLIKAIIYLTKLKIASKKDLEMTRKKQVKMEEPT